MAHFKSSAYLTEFKLTLKVTGGGSYSVSYTTPDNSTSANAAFISTSRLASEFRTAISNTLIPALTAAGFSGFSVEARGSSILIKSTTHDFKLSTSDGLGGQQFISFTDRVKRVADLPISSWDGYQVAVGSNKSTEDKDYYLRYVGEEQDGYWEEVAKWGAGEGLDPSSLPVIISNTAKNTFIVEYAPWGKRLAGDGVNTSKDPNFTGKSIRDIQFNDGRLCLICANTFALSKAGNSYVFYPDTAQTELPDAPILYTVASGKYTNIQHGVVVGGNLQLWSDESQTRVGSGGEPLSEKTTENPGITNYEYDGKVRPIAFGMGSLVFGTSRGKSTKVTEVLYREGRALGEINLTAHVQRLIRGPIVSSYVAEGLNMLLIKASQFQTNSLYLYQWFNNGEERLQSSWSLLNFEACTDVVWYGSFGSKLVFILQWPNSRITIEHLDVDPFLPDEGVFEPRLDHLRTSGFSFNSVTGKWDLFLPYPVPVAKRVGWVACQDRPDTGFSEGIIFDHTFVSDTQVEVEAPSSASISFGKVPVASRGLNRVYILGEGGAIVDSNPVLSALMVSHNNSGPYDVSVTYSSGVTSVESFNPRKIGDPSVINSKVAVEDSGSHRAKVGARASDCTIKLINNSIFPSSWDSLTYEVR
jgi:hypothetical protein